MFLRCQVTSLRKQPFLFARRRWGRAASIEENRLFSQAISIRSDDVLLLKSG